jgi:DNA-binding MltR family transcriptional regulator
VRVIVWLVEHADESDLIKEISTLSDRVAGILAPVILERRLLALIKSRWHDSKTRGGTVFAELFSASGELANHDSRLRIGLAMRLYSQTAFEEMRYIAKIRNAFAHEPGVKDFAVQPVCDFIPHLKIIDSYPAPTSFSMSGPATDPQSAADALFGVFVEASGVKDIQAPRNRYLRSIELFSLFLYREQIDPSASPRF